MLKTTKTLMLLPVMAALLACGCGQKRINTTQVPDKPMGSEAESAKAVTPAHFASYRVRRHDNLWAIAGKPSIYGDSFQWPELFKANRDLIHDPDLIYPRQDLRVEKGYSLEERNHARQTAMLTPKYAPHSAPRATLPVDYF